MTDPLEGAIAQLGERLLCKQEVVGSIPSGSTSGQSIPTLQLLVRETYSRMQCVAFSRRLHARVV